MAISWEVLGTVALAIVSGAGGSALVDLWWQPRQRRRKLATMLLAEISQNVERLQLWKHVQARNARLVIPKDLTVRLDAWSAIGADLSEVPADLLPTIMKAYTRFGQINQMRELAIEEERNLRATAHDPTEAPRAARLWIACCDGFVVHCDRAIELGEEVIPRLQVLAGVPESTAFLKTSADYARDAEQFSLERDARMALAHENFVQRRKELSGQ